MVNNGDRESENQADESVADEDQEGEGKMNILRELGVSKKTSLLRKGFQVKGIIVKADRKLRQPGIIRMR